MIKLTRSAMEHKLEPCGHNFSISITAETLAPDKIDGKVFVFQMIEGPDSPGDAFSNVASVHDLNTIPGTAPVMTSDPTPANFIPYYRTASVTFDCPTVEDAERIWTIIKYDVKQVIAELKAAEKLNITEEVIYE